MKYFLQYIDYQYIKFSQIIPLHSSPSLFHPPGFLNSSLSQPCYPLPPIKFFFMRISYLFSDSGAYGFDSSISLFTPYPQCLQR